MANAVYKILFSDKDTDQIGVRDEESFLHDVIIPIYEVLRKEARRNKGGKASHSKWRNYDDLNEYFWSEKCFGLKWPMDLEADFFVHSDQILRANEMGSQVPTGKRKPKTNFVEARTFWHLYRSFDRMWIFFILAFQAMLIVAWSPSGSLAALFDEDVFRSVLSIFITQAFLNFLQAYEMKSSDMIALPSEMFKLQLVANAIVTAALDIILSYDAWRSFTFSAILWYLLKFAVATVWMVVLLISYASSMQNPTRLVKIFSNWAGGWLNWSFYNYAVAIYLVPNLLAFIIFFVPSLGRTMERLNWRIITLLTWWAQPKLYVGRGMHENMFSLLKYTLFWTILLISKLAFSYYVEILPLVRPTKLIMEMHVDKYPWHEVFPNVTHNVGVVIAIWTPTILVYFMDAQIWYAIFSALFGVIHGGLSHLGEIRTLGMLRSRFEAIRSALCDCLVPSSKADKKKDMAKVNVSLDEPIHQKNLANFSKVWNKFIESMRTEDLLSNKERDLLLVQCFAVGESVIECPAFLLASKIPIAIDMAKGFKGNKDAELFKKIKIDAYMHSAIIECYEILRQILCGLLEDEADRK
ncbi:hypothetical protein Pint_07747 [Pistacia integerrima]|uniref:Uncharacterized protein n=1 Tax=Pistacia integerrima TaxID=434235 RepID=A0ACC0XX70_9ROSI|nr:hypothetical protein Pint_07747 [Pistacia integerrima]